MAPNFVQRVGLARTGRKQAVLKRADHRFIERIEFVSHNGRPPFFAQLRALREYHERAERCKRVFQKNIAEVTFTPPTSRAPLGASGTAWIPGDWVVLFFKTGAVTLTYPSI
jgi:hypothetical protein